MTPFCNRVKTPEEIELEKKRAALLVVKERCSVLEAAYSTLKSEIRSFEQIYEGALGGRIAILEDLEWQLNGLLDNADDVAPVTSTARNDAFAYFHHRTDLLDDDVEGDPDPKSPPLKSQIAVPGRGQGHSPRSGVG